MYKVRCKLVNFLGDAEKYPCHFNYEIGDEIYYDGVHFTGKICPYIIIPMMPVVSEIHLLGQNHFKNKPFRYRGWDIRDTSMAKYDGIGWRPRKQTPEAAFLPTSLRAEWARSAHFICADVRTLALFTVEPIDLSDSDFSAPFYRRAIAILEKIEAEPGIKTAEILGKFTEFERDGISPPLTPVLVEVLLGALSDMGHIQIQDGKAHSTGRQPPSRPKIG